jgi:methyl-accepting chemotaxis protein
MFAWGSDDKAILAAISKSQAVIEFDLTGKILQANDNFCKAVGYDLAEIQGRHHSMFVDPSYAASSEYRDFWARLGRGEFDKRQYKRIGKGGKEIWIEASYNPVFSGGKPYKVVKIATDITAQKFKAMEDAGKLAALSRSQAVIEFTPTGEVLTANDNFCSALGYQLAEIVGRHHSMFCEASYANSPSTSSSGPISLPESSSPTNSSGLARAGRKSGSRRPTIRSSMSRARSSASSSSPAT